MAGETQLLDLRRLYHCAAYNCAMGAISCSFSEAKFYQGFLFSEKPEKVCSDFQSPSSLILQKKEKFPLGQMCLFCVSSQNQFILENVIDASRTYNFPIEIDVRFMLWKLFDCKLMTLHIDTYTFYYIRFRLKEKRDTS